MTDRTDRPIVVATTLAAFVCDDPDTSEAWLRNAEAIQASVPGTEVRYFAGLELDARGLDPFASLIARMEEVGATWWTGHLDDGRTTVTTENRLRAGRRVNGPGPGHQHGGADDVTDSSEGVAVDILIPTYGRADRLAAVAANIHDATEVEHRVVFIIEDVDLEATRHLTDTVIVNEHTPNYAGACQTGYERTTAPYLFCGADDLRFHKGWDHAALATMTALPHLRVVGTNDLCNPYVSAGMHSTHSLVDRRYLDEVGGTVDAGPGSFLPTCFTHQFTDTEFIGTAKMRAVFAPCLESVVEHLHWTLGLSPTDATTAKTIAHLDDDAALYDERKELWCNLSR